MSVSQRVVAAIHLAFAVLLALAGMPFVVLDPGSLSPSTGMTLALMAALGIALAVLVVFGLKHWSRTGRRRWAVLIDVASVLIAGYAFIALVFFEPMALPLILAVGIAATLAIALVARPASSGELGPGARAIGWTAALIVACLTAGTLAAVYG